MNPPGDPDEPRSLEQLLADSRRHDWSVNWKTADALARIGDSAVPALLQSLEDPDGYVRNAAAIALGKIGNETATNALIRALRLQDDRTYEDDEDQEARISAAVALGKLRNDTARKALMAELERFRNPASTLASYIVEALGELGDPEAIPLILRSIDTGDFELQKIGYWALAQLGQEGIDILKNRAADQNQPGRIHAIRRLGFNKIESAAPLLMKILKDRTEGKYARYHAAEALGRIGDSAKALLLLLDLLEGPDTEIHGGVLSGLGFLRDSRAFGAIVNRVGDPKLRYLAVMALGELGDQAACKILSPLLQSNDYGLSQHAATALGKIGCTETLDALYELRDQLASSTSPISVAGKASVEATIKKLEQDRPAKR